MATMTLNQELDGVEITFTEKPAESTRQALKAAGFRWHKVRGLWYAKQTPERVALAEQIADGQTVAPATTAPATTAPAALDLEGIRKRYTVTADGEGLYAGWVGCNDGNLYGQELKKAILAELKKNGIKATARDRSSIMHTAFVFTVKVPAEMIDTAEAYADRMAHHGSLIPYWVYNASGECIHRDDLPMEFEARKAALLEHARHVYSCRVEPVEAFEKAVKSIVSSFNSDHSNSMIDYFDRGFYDRYNWVAA